MRSRLFALFGSLLLVAGLLAGWPAPGARAATGDGAVLSTAPVPAVMLPTGAARAVKIRYQTRNQAGRRAEAEGIVYYPHGTPPPGGWKVVSWAHGTSGIAPKCAPSNYTGAEQDRLQPSIAAALARGYVVTASDFIGMSGTPGTEYLAGRSVAYNVIDMVRAARNDDPTIGKRWASLGHSQGGHAALWASYLADDYAPELRDVGTVALAPANQLETLIPLLGQPAIPNIGPLNRTATFALYLLDGLNHARPGLHALNRLSPRGRYWLGRARTECVSEMTQALQNVPPGTLFARPLGDPPIGDALRDYAAIPVEGWQRARPILINQGLTDTVVLPPTTALLTAQLQHGGARVSTRTYPGDHNAVLAESMTDTFRAIDGYFR
ncbi:lipase family protein [Gordonia sp. (in: high G+C Gram-positive bacteria)]|uniref:lipase family protein n=1 Tax=unclassified Gordonia (in: high G+C Gram-positive bacteria) TaxID=2657482 RepID=UPI00262D60E8|nr:lipase family protein [Gordonia sp. (in: high G+C Gram-positive bacteria)]